MKFNLSDITKIPNILTAVRILLIPLFVAVFLWENGNVDIGADPESEGSGYVIAAIIIIISGLTDAADGFIARKFDMITDLGKVLDPFADKLTQAAVVVCLIFRYSEIWQAVAALFGIILIKEITMLVMGVLFLKKGQDLGGAKWFGKLATIVFYVLVIILIGAPSLSTPAALVMVSVMALFAVLSFVLYMREYYRLWQSRESGDENDKG